MAAIRRFAPDYQVREQLAAGGMGAVHLGTMVGPAGERVVAIKRLLDRGSFDAAAVERIVAEARLVFRLTHANICQVLDLAEGSTDTFIVMEFVDGSDLHSLCRRLSEDQQQLDAASAIHIAREVARGLGYAHRRADDRGAPMMLVHGDVSPRNILISREGEVKLTDFGIARAIGTFAPGNLLRGGTPGFMAPETMSEGDHRADLYSLGMTLYASLGGVVRENADVDLDALSQARPELPKELLKVIARATLREPEARFASAHELEQALAFQLARHYPSFTPESLAEVVRARPKIASVETDADATTPMLDGAQPLESLTQRGVLVTQFSRVSSPGEPIPHPGTKVVGPNPRVRRVRGLTLMFAGIAAVGALGLFPLLRAVRPSPPAPAPQAIVVPTPTAITAPAIAAPPPTSETHDKAPTPHPKKARTVAAVSPEAAHAAVGYLSVDSTPWGQVFVDGRRIANETPIYRVAIPAGPHRVSVFDPSTKHFSSEQRIVIVAGQSGVLGFHPR